MVFNSNEVDYPYFPFRLKIDYVLVSRCDNLSRQYHRSAFEEAIRKEGLIISHEIVYPFLFTLISTPFWRLTKEAEKSVLYFPLRKVLIEPSFTSFCQSFFHSTLFVAPDTVNYLNVPFQLSHGPLFINFEDERKFFSSSQRSLLTHQILCDIDINKFIERRNEEGSKSSIRDDPDIMKRKGLMFMRIEDAYQDSFILHDPSEEEPYFKKIKNNSLMDFKQFVGDILDDPRSRLSSIWSNWLLTQPLNMIRNYFGEQIGFYFAWQGTFCTLLWSASFVGLGVFIFGITKSIITTPDLWPQCIQMNSTQSSSNTQCSNLSNLIHLLSRLTLNVFDTELTAFYALFMSIWGSIFLQTWLRNSEVLKYEWDCEQTRENEGDRAQFYGCSTDTDPITGETQLVYPEYFRMTKMFISFIIVILCMALVVCSVLGVMLYKVFISNHLKCGKQFDWTCSLSTSFLPTIMNTGSTMILGTLYSSTAKILNDWENHRTESEYTNALIIKLFAFQFVNNYTSLFYLVLIRPEKHGFQSNGLFGLGPEYKDICIEGTCGSLLSLQLIMHLLIKPFPKWSKDIVIPYFVRIIRLSRLYSKEKDISMEEMIARKEEKNVLVREWMKPDTGDFVLGEFSEKMILFGTTMMFAALFPLAPLIALIIGLIDIRIDASRLVWFNRRPIPVRVPGIGIWLNILTFIQYTAVLTNAFIVAFTSDFCTSFFSGSIECSVENRLVIVLVFQNATFLLKYILQSIIPTTSNELRISQRRKKYVSRYIKDEGKAPEGEFRKKSELIKIARRAMKSRPRSSSQSGLIGNPVKVKVTRIGKKNKISQ